MHNSNSNLPLATWYRSDENYLQDAPHKSWHCAQPKVLNGFRVTLHWKYPDDIILTPHFGKCVFIRVRQGKIPNEQISEATEHVPEHIPTTSLLQEPLEEWVHAEPKPQNV